MNYFGSFKKEKGMLVMRIPLKQASYNALHKYTGDTDNLIGIIAGKECTISHLIDLGYKGTQQEGDPIIHFSGEKILKEVCKMFDIDVWEYPLCKVCNKPLRSSFTMDERGNICFEHEK